MAMASEDLSLSSKRKRAVVTEIKEVAKGEDTCVKQEFVKVSMAVMILTQVHASYSLLFSTSIYHTQVETVVGGLFGALICLLSFETDLVSDSMAEVFNLFSKKEKQN